MQGGLSIEQDDVSVFHVSFDDVSDAKGLGGAFAIPEGEGFDEGVFAGGADEVGPRVHVGSVAHPLSQLFYVVAGDLFWVGSITAVRKRGGTQEGERRKFND